MGRVKAIAWPCALFLLLAGCFWRSYGARLAMHTDLLVAMAQKGTDLVDTDRFTPENLPELHYPLDRARAFAADAARRSGDDPPGSLRAFQVLLAAYGEFCDAAERARQEAGTPHAAVHEATDRVRQRAAEVHQALASEGRA
jgi:hypothetical protein